MLENISSALSSIWSNKLRSLLTLLGVVIGVSSVTILIALGQGLKSDVASLIQGFGTNVIFVVAGKIDTKAGSGGAGAGPNPADIVNGDILTLNDVDIIKQDADVAQVSKVSLVSGTLQVADKTASGTIFGTDPNIIDTLEIFHLESGQVFASDDAGPVIVLSNATKQQLFGDANAVGKKMLVGKTEFTVEGVLGKPKTTSAVGSQFDTLSFIPFNQAVVMNKGQAKIVRIIIKAGDKADVKKVKADLKAKILVAHDNQENFTLLTQDDILGLFDTFLSLATAMVSAIASISLVVGGIGIMNIMLVTVTERTREIGLRMAVGATRGAILVQFLVEAVVITLIGGLIGLGIAFGVGQIIEAKSALKPVFSWEVLLVTVGLSILIGVIFGIWPALRAARKDPIEALRYE